MNVLKSSFENIYETLKMLFLSQVISLPLEFHCSDRSAAWWRKECLYGTGREGLSVWQHGILETQNTGGKTLSLTPSPPGGITGTRPVHGWSSITIPGNGLHFTL